MFLCDELVVQSIAAWTVADSVFTDMVYPVRETTFENICGNLNYTEPTQNTTQCTALSLLHSTEHDKQLQHALCQGDKLFGFCKELLTVYGNLTLRADKDNYTRLTFKGVRDLQTFMELVTSVLFGGMPPMEQPTHSASVHMVVATGCTGSKIGVSHGCLLEYLLQAILGDIIYIIARTEEEMNSVKFNVNNWAKMFQSFRRIGLHFDQPCVEIESISCSSNTVTVTKKGCVIIRLSWSRQVPWTEQLRTAVLHNSSALVQCLKGFG